MSNLPESKKWDMRNKCISRFINDRYYLSNSYPSPLMYEGILYPNVECAFQAAKTMDKEKRLIMSYTINPSVSKQDGRAIRSIRKDWEEVKYDIMKTLVLRKFRISVLQRALLATGKQTLIEGNTWGNSTWGTSTQGYGKNWLGIILMEVRDFYKEMNS